MHRRAMESSNKKLTLIFLILFLSLLLFLFSFIFLRRLLRRRSKLDRSVDYDPKGASDFGGSRRASEELIRFEGGGDLAIADILDAPGEVIGKSPYGTLYEASVVKSASSPEVMVLRFLRPACGSGGLEEVGPAARAIGGVRHANVVPLRAVYVGPRGEMLLVHPFYDGGNLAHFITDKNVESHKWDVIHKIALGIAKGLDHLHAGLAKPIAHGNLKSKNILLDRRTHHPYISDHGIHLLLNPKAGQELLEGSALQGYKAPELMKIKDVCESTDVYSLGVILLELLTGKKPISRNPSNSSQQFYLPNVVRTAVLRHRVTDLYHPDLLMNETSDQSRQVTEECVLKLVQLAISCCSPSPSLRPPAKEVLRKIEEIGR